MEIKVSPESIAEFEDTAEVDNNEEVFKTQEFTDNLNAVINNDSEMLFGKENGNISDTVGLLFDFSSRDQIELPKELCSNCFYEMSQIFPLNLNEDLKYFKCLQCGKEIAKPGLLILESESVEYNNLNIIVNQLSRNFSNFEEKKHSNVSSKGIFLNKFDSDANIPGIFNENEILITTVTASPNDPSNSNLNPVNNPGVSNTAQLLAEAVMNSSPSIIDNAVIPTRARTGRIRKKRRGAPRTQFRSLEEIPRKKSN
jgi:hypothetical protein